MAWVVLKDDVCSCILEFHQERPQVSTNASSLMLPPTFHASLVPSKRDLMLDRLSNDQFLAIPTLDTPIITSPYNLRVIRETVRSQFVFVARE